MAPGRGVSARGTSSLEPRPRPVPAASGAWPPEAAQAGPLQPRRPPARLRPPPGPPSGGSGSALRPDAGPPRASRADLQGGGSSWMAGNWYYGHGVSAWVSGTRTTTLAGRLARMGFADAARAERIVTSELALDVSPGALPGAPAGAPGRDDPVLEAIGAAADPDVALAGVARVAGTAGRP